MHGLNKLLLYLYGQAKSLARFLKIYLHFRRHTVLFNGFNAFRRLTDCTEKMHGRIWTFKTSSQKLLHLEKFVLDIEARWP